MSANAIQIAERLHEIKTEIANKCGTDPAFRRALLEDPNATVEKEYQLESGTLNTLELNVVVERENTLVLTIPEDTSDMELSEDQLDQVSGGSILPMPMPFPGPIWIGPIVLRTPRRTGNGGW